MSAHPGALYLRIGYMLLGEALSCFHSSKGQSTSFLTRKSRFDSGWEHHLMSDTFNLYLTDNGKEELLKSSEDPNSIRRIAVSRNMKKRLRKPGTSLRATKNYKNLRFDVLERICLDQWFEAAETPSDPSC